jgi:hypothetical protein
VCGEPMGGTVTCPGPRAISLQAAGALPFTQVEIMRNGQTVMTLQPDGDEVEFNGEDSGTGGADWYYARLTHAGGEMAWSSPVWVQQPV